MKIHDKRQVTWRFHVHRVPVNSRASSLTSSSCKFFEGFPRSRRGSSLPLYEFTSAFVRRTSLFLQAAEFDFLGFLTPNFNSAGSLSSFKDCPGYKRNCFEAPLYWADRTTVERLRRHGSMWIYSGFSFFFNDVSKTVSSMFPFLPLFTSCFCSPKLLSILEMSICAMSLCPSEAVIFVTGIVCACLRSCARHTPFIFKSGGTTTILVLGVHICKEIFLPNFECNTSVFLNSDPFTEKGVQKHRSWPIHVCLFRSIVVSLIVRNSPAKIVVTK